VVWEDLAWRSLESDFQCVQDWLLDVATRRTGSKEARRTYLERLTDYCNHRQLNPDELLAEGDKVASRKRRTTVAEVELDRYFHWLTTEKVIVRGKRKGENGLSRSTAKTLYGSIRSFFRSNEIPFFSKTPGGGSKAKSSLSLSKADIKKVVDASSLRVKYALCGLACTGLRPGDFVKLTYGDIQQDYEAGEQRLYIEKISEKEDLRFGTFLSRQARGFVCMLIEQRKRDGEVITNDTPLLDHVSRDERGKPISEDQLARIVKDAGERVGLHLTPKMFRKNFRTQASPVIGRDAVCKMAAWTIPGVGGNYFLPPREKCLELYRKIENLFTYEEEKSMEEHAVENVLNFAIAQGIPTEKGEEIRHMAWEKQLRADEVAQIIRPLVRQLRGQGGGLPFELQARKALADIVLGAVKDVKERLAQNNDKS